MNGDFSNQAIMAGGAVSGAATDAEPRKPRFAIMGEFSAGKSTLTNLLIGTEALPTKVTATRLPPVWVSFGDDAPHRVDLDDQEHPIDINDLDAIPLQETKYIRSFHQSDALELCDLIDMPGISDPNMPAEIWERAFGLADGVIWCTHANQAWRQSEAAVWAEVRPSLYARSFLLLTRIDKIHGERDRGRIVRRVEKETNGQFKGIFPISLTQAMAAGEDWDKWQASGADEFAQALIAMVSSITNPGAASSHERPEPSAQGGERVVSLTQAERPAEPAPSESGKVLPQRVTRTRPKGTRTARPVRTSSSG